MGNIMIGARWDVSTQDARFRAARDQGVLDYVEVNYPVCPSSDPSAIGLPIIAHTSNNPIASSGGIPESVARAVKQGADRADSPWVGEHLAWLSPEESGAVGYVFTPLLTEEFVEQAAHNTRCLSAYYGRRIALELAPVYTSTGTYPSELHFLNDVARRADALIILDVAHWMISNENLERPIDFGLDALDAERIVELHVAGMRKSSGSRFWHDAHGLPLRDEVLAMAARLSKELPALRAITFEHAHDAPEQDFYVNLARLKEAIS